MAVMLERGCVQLFMESSCFHIELSVDVDTTLCSYA